MVKSEEVLDAAKRAVALGFAAVYVHTHHSPRDSSLRVAYLAYRFLNGDDVVLINAEADHDNAVREAQAHAAKHVIEHRIAKIPKWKLFRKHERTL